MAGSRVERRISDARARVVAAAWELLGERPWSAITVADICERADVAPRTFHRYFPDKAELLFADAQAHEDELLRAMRAHPLDAGRLRGYVEAVLLDMAAAVEGYGAADLAQRQRVIASAPELAARDLMKRARLQLIAAGVLADRLGTADPLRARVLAGTALHAFYAAMEAWAADGGTLSEVVVRALDATRLGD